MKQVKHRYAYIRVCQIDGIVSFDHCWLQASDEEDAYIQGAKQLPADIDHPFLNDYAFLDELQN